MLPPVRLIEPDPTGPVTVPPHWGEAGMLETVMPLGKESENPTPIRETEFGFVIVKLSVLVRPT